MSSSYSCFCWGILRFCEFGNLGMGVGELHVCQMAGGLCERERGRERERAPQLPIKSSLQFHPKTWDLQSSDGARRAHHADTTLEAVCLSFSLAVTFFFFFSIFRRICLFFVDDFCWCMSIGVNW